MVVSVETGARFSATREWTFQYGRKYAVSIRQKRNETTYNAKLRQLELERTTRERDAVQRGRGLRTYQLGAGSTAPGSPTVTSTTVMCSKSARRSEAAAAAGNSVSAWLAYGWTAVGAVRLLAVSPRDAIAPRRPSCNMTISLTRNVRVNGALIHYTVRRE